MKLSKLSFCICFFTTIFISAQTKDITLESIWNGSFRTERMDVLHSMANGQQYSVLNFDRQSRTTTIDIYDYKTLKKVKTLVNSESLEAISYFTNYTFSDDENKVILATNEASIFRRSTLGNYYVYNVNDMSLILITEDKIQEPTFSPDGDKVAFAKANNLYVKDLQSGKTTQ